MKTSKLCLRLIFSIPVVTLSMPTSLRIILLLKVNQFLSFRKVFVYDISCSYEAVIILEQAAQSKLVCANTTVRNLFSNIFYIMLVIRFFSTVHPHITMIKKFIFQQSKNRFQTLLSYWRLTSPKFDVIFSEI